MGFATWMYHKDLGGRLLHSQAELDALGPEWADTPAAFETESAPQLPAGEMNQELSPSALPDAPEAPAGDATCPVLPVKRGKGKAKHKGK